MKEKSIPGAVLAIVGAVFAFIGGLGMAICADAVDSLTGSNYSWAAYVFGIGSAVLAILGAVFDFSKPKVGGVLLVVCAGFLVAACCLLYWDWLCIVALVLVGIGCILSFAIRKPAQ